jgi:AraC-like DNA-binding protein
MNAWSLIDTINIISVCFLFIFSLFLFTHKRGKPVSNKILGMFLIAWALALLNFVLSRPNRFTPSLLPVFLFMNAFDFLVGPLLYLYVKSVAYRDFFWRKSQLFHGLPLFFYLLSLAAVGIMAPASLNNVDELRKSFFGTVGMPIMTTVIAVQLLTYLGISVFVLRSYRARISNAYSSLGKLSLSWLHSIVGGFGLIWVIGAANYMAAIGTRRGAPFLVLSITNMLISFGMASVIVFRGLKQPEIFSGIEEKPKYERSPLTEEESDRLLASLKDFMEEKKPYLVAGLSISELAKELGCPPRALSQVINSRMRKNFVDFINSYRVEEAKKLLSISGSNGKTVLEIAYESGFNSKSVFNKAFRKHVGAPPKDLKEKSGRAGPRADRGEAAKKI